MVVIDSKDPKHTWVWMDSEETKRFKRGTWSFIRVRGRTPEGHKIDIDLRDDEILQSLIHENVRGVMMHRHVAMLNGLHNG